MLKLLLLILFITHNCFALSANISKNKILIDGNFTGDKITIFGNKQDEGKILIVFKSSKISYKVYNRQKTFGVWQNANPRIFKNIYSIYSLISEEGIKITRDDFFRDFELGILNINFYNFTMAREALKNAEYKEAFLKHKNNLGAFTEEYGKVKTFKDSDMFIAELIIPSDIKIGNYLLEIFLIDENKIQEFSIFKIIVEQVGVVKKIKDLSQKNKLLYASIAIVLSIVIAFFFFLLAKILYYNKM